MKIRWFISNLGLALLFTILTAYSPIAPADSEDICFSILAPAPRALDLDKVSKQTYTAYADEFMQAIWKTFTLKDANQITAFRTPFFTNFVKDNFAELKINHSRNQSLLEEDLKAFPKYHAAAVKSLQTISDYINRIETQLSAAKDFSYKEMIVFSYVLTLTRERLAIEKLKDLRAKGDEAVRKRYPQIPPIRVTQYLAARIYPDDYVHRFWTNIYTYNPTWDEENLVLRLNSNGIQMANLKRQLILPTPYIPGAPAFFRTFLFKANPVSLAKECEVVDNNIINSPIENFDHDVNHHNNLTDNNKDEVGQQSNITNQDLQELRRRVVALNNPRLLKNFYFLFYYLKFELLRLNSYQDVISLAASTQQLLDSMLHNHLQHFFLARYSEYYNVSMTTISAKALMTDMAEIIDIFSTYADPNHCGRASLNCLFTYSKAKEQYENNILRINEWHPSQYSRSTLDIFE